MDSSAGPRPFPDVERYVDLAGDLQGALVALSGDHPQAWQRCRAMILRYLGALHEDGFGPLLAHTLLRRALDAWPLPALDGALRERLERLAGYWVGTAHGLRWRHERPAALAATAAAPGAPNAGPRDAPGTAAAIWESAPQPGGWEQMRAWRAALTTERQRLAAKRPARQKMLTETRVRARQLCDTARALVEESGRAAIASRAGRTRAANLDRWTEWMPVAPLCDGGDRATTGTATSRAAEPAARRVSAPDAPPRQLADAELLALALRIQRAVSQRPTHEPQHDILSSLHRLPPNDEARLEAVLAVLPRPPHDRRGSARRERRGREQPDD